MTMHVRFACEMIGMDILRITLAMTECRARSLVSPRPKSHCHWQLKSHSLLMHYFIAISCIPT